VTKDSDSSFWKHAQLARDFRLAHTEPDSNQEIVPATEDVFGIQHGGTIDDDIMRRVALIPMLLQVLAESGTTIKRLKGITAEAPRKELES